jgi:hypothetical protein
MPPPAVDEPEDLATLPSMRTLRALDSQTLVATLRRACSIDSTLERSYVSADQGAGIDTASPSKLSKDDARRPSRLTRPRTTEGFFARTVVLVEGISDQRALEALAQRRARNLDRERISIVPMGGAQAIGSFLELFGPQGFNVRLAGLCDATEEDDFRRGLERAGATRRAARPSPGPGPGSRREGAPRRSGAATTVAPVAGPGREAVPAGLSAASSAARSPAVRVQNPARSRCPARARLERRGQLAERLARDELDRDAVLAERGCDFSGRAEAKPLPTPAEDLPLRRLRQGGGNGERSGVSALGTPAALALDHRSPERDAADDLMDDVLSRPGWHGNRVGGLRRGRGRIDTTAAALIRRGVGRQQLPERPVGALPEAAEGDLFGPRQPDRPEAWRAEAKGTLDLDDTPAAPADGRGDVVRCARPGQRAGSGARSGSPGASAGRSRSGASSGSSRGTGSSTGSTV